MGGYGWVPPNERAVLKIIRAFIAERRVFFFCLKKRLSYNRNYPLGVQHRTTSLLINNRYTPRGYLIQPSNRNLIYKFCALTQLKILESIRTGRILHQFDGPSVPLLVAVGG